MRVGRGSQRPLGALGSVLAWAGASASAVFTVIRVFGVDHHFLLATLVSFTPYVALAAVVPVVIAALLRRWPAAFVAVLAVAVLGFLVIPRAMSGGPHPRGPGLRILTMNMHHGNASAAELVALVRREHVDVLAVEEYTPAAKVRLARAGLAHWLPFTDPAPLSGLLDTGLYARYPLRQLISIRRKSRSTEVEAHIRVPGAREVVVRVVHVHVLSLASTRLWLRMLDELPPADPRVLRIIAGDFNATLDHSPLRAVLGRGYADAAARTGHGLDPTWPSDHRLGITIDHVLVDRRVGVDRVRTVKVADTDHRAVIADLTLPAQP